MPEGDKRFFVRARQLDVDDELEFEETGVSNLHLDSDDSCALIDANLTARRVNVVPSPYLDVHFREHPLRLTIDCGATTNMIRSSVMNRLNLPLKPA